jgi:hypothetical protein
MGRASEYAGWWGGGSLIVNISSESSVAYELYQQPSFSVLAGVGGSTAGDWSIQSNGTFDLTGITGFTDYNAARFTQVYTVYPTWPTSGIGSGDYVSIGWYNEVNDNSSLLFYNPSLQLTDSNTTLTIQGGGNQGQGGFLTLPGSYTLYMNRWLTYVCSRSETKSTFANWTGSSSTGSVYTRTALYDTETGERLGMTDQVYGSTTVPDLGSFTNPLPANNSGSYGISVGGFGSGTNPTFYDSRLGAQWFSLGTCFDPESVTNRTWLTTRPDATIGTARAWYNIQMGNFKTLGSNYYVETTGQDLYSQADDVMVKNNGYDSTTWTNNYSNTIFPRSKS